MLLYLAAASQDKYTVAIRKYLKGIWVLVSKRNIKKILSPWSGKLFWSGTFTDQVSEQRLIQSGTSQGQSINNSAQTNLLLSSHIAANYTELIQDLNGVTTGTWSEQHCDAQANRKQETSHHLPNLINFFNKCYCKWWYHCRFTSWYWGEDCFWFGWQKTWWDIPYRKNQAKTFATMRKSKTLHII